MTYLLQIQLIQGRNTINSLCKEKPIQKREEDAFGHRDATKKQKLELMVKKTLLDKSRKRIWKQVTNEGGDDGAYDRGGARDRENDGLEKSVIAEGESDGGRCVYVCVCVPVSGGGNC